jgi:hypothetical protein
MRKPAALLAVGMLCLVAWGCGKGTEPTPADQPQAEKKQAAGGPMDEKQFADFLAAARDWQEKTQGLIDNERWKDRLDISRLKDAAGASQPNKTVVAAQVRVAAFATYTNLAIIPMGGWAALAAQGNADDVKKYGELQAKVRKEFSRFVAAVDAYGKKQFDRVPEDPYADSRKSP